MASECCWAKASTSALTVRVCTVVKRIAAPGAASDSTMVLPQVPSPTTAALIMLVPYVGASFRPGQHGKNHAGEHPEHAVLDPADHPDPFLGDLPGRGAGDEQMERGDCRDIGRVDVENQRDCQTGFDGAGDIHPG